MSNADKFKTTFGIYATELWSMPEQEFLEWLESGWSEPERKTGRWLTDDEYIDCSVCRREKWSRVPYENLVKRFRHCPNCGAKMVGEQE